MASLSAPTGASGFSVISTLIPRLFLILKPGCSHHQVALVGFYSLHYQWLLRQLEHPDTPRGQLSLFNVPEIDPLWHYRHVSFDNALHCQFDLGLFRIIGVNCKCGFLPALVPVRLQRSPDLSNTSGENIRYRQKGRR